MISFDVLTIFPEIIKSYADMSMMKKAREEGHIDIEAFDIREYSENKHKKVDDYPYSGGGGMVMTPQPIFSAFEHVDSIRSGKTRRVYMSPKGRRLDNDIIREYSKQDSVMILCGHYEGVDQRVIDELIDDEISIGDYVLTGGELPALVFIDAVTRFIEGVLSSKSALKEESHYEGLLEYPQYTRPYDFKGMRVPDILLSGHEGNIKKWKRLMSIRMTIKKRPDIDIHRYASDEEIREAQNIDMLFTHK